jgi:hypothetical protein
MESQEERIIRLEGKEFVNSGLDVRSGKTPVSRIHNLQRRLLDFYSPEYKAIFLDEVENTLKNDLQDHRNRSHEGKPSPTCHYEIDTEKVLFYVKQELSILPKIAHQRSTEESDITRNKVFVSYSHYDKKYLDDIQRHFKPFLKDIDFWDDTKITPGKKWKSEIEHAIKQAKVAILLVSTDFLGSDFIATDEIPPLLEAAENEGAAILIVIVEPCLFEEFPKLNVYQAMNPPSRPVANMDHTEKEDLYVNLVRQTKRVLSGQAR